MSPRVRRSRGQDAAALDEIAKILADDSVRCTPAERLAQIALLVEETGRVVR
jgi:hypothetical protein